MGVSLFVCESVSVCHSTQAPQSNGYLAQEQGEVPQQLSPRV